ncbi:MAG: acyl dehydratase [Rhodobacteraceae bacterium]|nr:acyl dehydratase [Paracoccaceae bacterium]
MKTRERHDMIDPARAAALHAVLNLSGPSPAHGDPLPPFWHYIHFWEALPASGLGRDGHPRTGSFIPDLGLPRRMWAGGNLGFLAPLRVGTPATKRSTVTNVAEKSGRSGKLAIVTLTHEIIQSGIACIREEQNLIYRAEADPNDAKPAPPRAPTNEIICRERSFSTTDLFRYSALTFNGHRIHYDRNYACDVEGYLGLVVHGPLLAQTLIEIAEGMLGSLKTFDFRATAPAFDTELISFCALPTALGLDLWARGPDGRLCMNASATA